MSGKLSFKQKLHRFLATFNALYVISFGALVLALAYGTFGIYLLRHQFTGIKDIEDAFYFAVVVFSTLGDNTIAPQTAVAKHFIVSMLFWGFGIFATFFSIAFSRAVIHLNKIASKLQGGRVHMKDHVILCGYSILTESLINKLIKHKIPYVLVDKEQHPELGTGQENSFLYASVPNRPDNLVKANIEFCRSIIAISESDSDNILAAINANVLKKKYNASYQIIIRVLYEENIETAQNSGATNVISPTLLAANAILHLL